MVGFSSADGFAVFEAYQEQVRGQLPPALVVDGDVVVQVIGESSGLFPSPPPACPFPLSSLPECDLAIKLVSFLRPSNDTPSFEDERFSVSSIPDPKDCNRKLRLVVFAGKRSAMAQSSAIHDEARKDAHRTFSFFEGPEIGSSDTPIAMFWATDHCGKVTYISGEEAIFTGMAIEDLLADGWLRCVHPADAAQFLDTMKNAVADRQPFSFTSRKKRFDGEYVWFRTHSTPRFDQYGEFLGHSGVCVDVTEQNRVRDALLSGQVLTHSVLDNSPFLCAYAGIDLTYQYVNRRYADFWGKSRDQIIGKTIPETVGTFLEVLEPYLKRTLAGETVFHESKVVHESGETSLLEITHIPAFANGSVVGFYCFVTDVTTPRKHNRLLNLVLNNVSAMVVFLNTDLELRYSNQQFLDCLGVQDRNVIGIPIKELIGAEAFASAKLHFDLALRGEECTFESQIPTLCKGPMADGPLTGLVKLVPEIEDGVVTGICGLVLDVSDLRSTQKELRRSEARFELAVAGSSVGIMEFNLDDPDWAFADHFESLLGFEKGELNNSRRLIRDLVHPDDEEVNEEFNKLIAAGLKTKSELRLRTKSGRYRWFEIFTQSTNELAASSPFVVGTIADIDDLKTAELESANQVKLRDEFLAMLSHELRNPMASIVLATECLHGSEDLPASLENVIQIISRQSLQISSLLNDLLDVSRVTLNRIEFKKAPLDLNHCVSECANNYLALAAEKGLRLHLDVTEQACAVFGDESRLTQVVSNLLDNAIKYTPEGGDILVSTDLRDDQVVLAVRDSGIGIAANKLSRIFDLFFQENVSIHRSNGGLGVGLFMVQHIVKAHEGIVVAKSEGVGHGCLFEISLPSCVIEQPTAAAPTVTSARPNVVLVEDNDDARFVIHKLLTMKGLEVAQFSEGESASIAIPELEPEVAIIDVGLPGKSGLDLAREFHNHPKLKDMLLIALTGYGQESDREVVIEAGFDVHLVKPVAIDDIMQAINSRGVGVSSIRKSSLG